ncbi:MAG: alpha/beta fold hydrolase, partial [Actinomycetota bacterium]
MATTTAHQPAIEADLEVLEATIAAMTEAAGINPIDLDQLRAAGSDVVTQPAVVARHLTQLGFDQLRIALGLTDIEPDAKDRRFSDDWFRTNPIYRRLAQAHVANERAAGRLLSDLELDETSRLRAEFLTNIITSSLAPTNHLLGNPAALKRAWKTKGRSLVSGLRNAVDDLANNGGMPSMVDTEPFTPGETVAATPGSVIHRNELFELIQYTPSTEQVYERPVFIVPPQINKYYILDLAPGRSLAEHLVGQGQQVFMVSWRNPSARQREWDLDTYVEALMEGTEVVRTITGSPDLNLLGVCAGGITAAALTGYLEAIGDERINSLNLLVTVLDWATPSTMGSFLSPAGVAVSKAQSGLTGTLSGDDLAKTFAWMRPNDLVWNYWVNNYLEGKKPAAFDVLSWNVDSTNLPTGLHHDFLGIAAGNTMTDPGATVVLGEPIDLGRFTRDSFVVGAVTDHITPWRACYQTVNHLGGSPRFVLSSQGHIQALVNPSGNPKGSFQTNAEADATGGTDADTWLEGAHTRAGSWWDEWTE